MSLDTYDGLIEEIAVWAWRKGDVDFEAAAPTMVAACEHMLNYGTESQMPLRTSEMETSDSVSLLNGAGDLPDDYLEWRGVTVGDLPYQVIELGTPSDNQVRYGWANSGVAARFQINGTTLKTYPASSSDVQIDYYAKIPSLSKVRQTNWLLRKAPMVYLYGSLMHSAPFMQDDERVVLWGNLYSQFAGGLIRSDKSARFSKMTSRVMGPTP